MAPFPWPRWIAHRGAGRLAPENTLAAFRLGASHGYSAYECDVKLSADDVPFLLHDATLDRTTNARGRAADRTWSELSRLDAGSWHSRAYAGEPPACFDAIAAYCRAQDHALNIEIKPTPGDERRTGEKVARAAEQRLASFLAELVPHMGRAERQHWAGMYIRGLLLDGERKSIEPMAARLPGADVQALCQFVNQSPWPWEPVQEALTGAVVDALLPEAVYLLDATSFPKQGTHSVGVARQYCGALGKTANCQVAVSVHLGTETTSVPLTWALYLPEPWTTDPARRAEVGIPPTIAFQTKPDLALACLDRVRAWGLQRRPVLADSEFGNSWDVRQGLHTRGYPYCVQVEAPTVAWATRPVPPAPRPTPGRGRPRTRPRRDDLPTPVSLAVLAQALPGAAWRTVTWRPGTKGPLTSRFARFPVWCAHEWRRGGPFAPREETCLVEWPVDQPAPTKYWLADLREEPLGLRRLVRLAKGRWRIEQDYRELKDELGLDHFEGRSWTGWHHHVTLVSMAYAFLVLERVRAKKNLAADVAPDPAPAPAPAPPTG